MGNISEESAFLLHSLCVLITGPVLSLRRCSAPGVVFCAWPHYFPLLRTFQGIWNVLGVCWNFPREGGYERSLSVCWCQVLGTEVLPVHCVCVCVSLALFCANTRHV